MKITEKLQMDINGLMENGPINIVIFGDSVSHGSFNADEIDYEAVYHNRLRKKINAVRNYVPVNIINASIGGLSAYASLPRMERDVFSHNPDLVIICFGLNDVNMELEIYLNSLKKIFDRCIESKVDAIFMTPNMLNTSVSPETEDKYYEYAHKTADMQNNGRMDRYMTAAVELAKSIGVKVCDCYAMWKELSKSQDITELLANKINHPTKEMHELFAQSLFECIFDGVDEIKHKQTSTMYKGE
ncbi:MAG: GDSL family lipase [Ruminococcaceae bacterium]|nr:GDSL family lipase [Oscillospiraceae bacterium]